MFKKFMTEFKDFALKGNVMDMAIGVIIGGAFGNIVSSLTDNFINPLISLVTGGAKKDPETGEILVSAGTFKIGTTEFGYGKFISSVVNFLIIALVLFILLKTINAATAKAAALAKKPEETPAPTTKACPYCKSDINIEAVRCPNCTTILDESKVPVSLAK